MREHAVRMGVEGLRAVAKRNGYARLAQSVKESWQGIGDLGRVTEVGERDILSNVEQIPLRLVFVSAATGEGRNRNAGPFSRRYT